MSVLADPLAAGPDGGVPSAGYYRRFRELLDAGAGCTEAVSLGDAHGLAPGGRFLFEADGPPAAQLAEGPVPRVVRQNLPPLSAGRGPSGRQGVAYLPVLPRVTLLIVGGGHVGQAVARLAAEVDFDVWVVDDRESYASRQRFPTARRLLVGDIGA